MGLTFFPRKIKKEMRCKALMLLSPLFPFQVKMKMQQRLQELEPLADLLKVSLVTAVFPMILASIV